MLSEAVWHGWWLSCASNALENVLKNISICVYYIYTSIITILYNYNIIIFIYMMCELHKVTVLIQGRTAPVFTVCVVGLGALSRELMSPPEIRELLLLCKKCAQSLSGTVQMSVVPALGGWWPGLDVTVMGRTHLSSQMVFVGRHWLLEFVSTQEF